jgi:Ca2+-binding RTX toxin-like protein
MPNITPNRAFPYEPDEFDILVGTLGGDGPRDEDGTTYGRDGGSNGLSYNFQGTDGNDEFFGGSNDDILKGGKGLDALYGEGGDDWIYGGADTDWLSGDDGNDHLFGEDGCDQLYGGDGGDELYGGELNDWLVGNQGNDILVGGGDADGLTGGSGYDTFQFEFPKDWLFVPPDSSVDNPDQIMDFSSADDLIDLQGWDLNPLPAQYAEDTIGYNAGYAAAKMHAESLFDGGTRYVFVTDKVDGYLFVDWLQADDDEQFPGLYEGAEMGVILVGLTNVSDFDFTDII